MTRVSGGVRCLVGLTLLLAAGPTAASGQTLLTFSAGPAQYDLSGTGWSGVAGAQVEVPVRPWLGFEVGSGIFRYRTQADQERVMLLPEAGLRAHASGPIPVYFAAGLGRTVTLNSGGRDDVTLYGAAGLVLGLGGGWMARPEMKLRLVDLGSGGIVGYTLGFSMRIGP